MSFCSGGTGGGGGTTPGTGGGGTGAGVGGGGGTSTQSGACAYFDTQLNRILCGQRSSASSCNGKWMGYGTTCAGLKCGPLGDNDVQKCTVGNTGTGGGGGTGTGGGGGSTTFFCNRYRIEDPGSSSTPGSGTVLDMSTGMRWTRHTYTPEKTQPDAISHCSARGWRLPTRSEALAIADDCCATINGVHSCAWVFRGMSTWTTTTAGAGQAYYVVSRLTCLPSTCINSTSTTHGVMCIKSP